MTRKSNKPVKRGHKLAPGVSGRAIPPSSSPVDGPSQPSPPPALATQADTPVTPAGQRKQTWMGLPKKSKIRAKAAAIMALKVQGASNEEIAAQVGLSERSLRQYLWIAGKNGWLRTDDPHEHAEHVILHKVVKGLEELVDARSAVTGLPDRETILESAKGLGLFKDHSKPEMVPNQQANQLTINVVMPEGSVATARPGTTSGTPAYQESDVINVTPLPNAR